MQYGFHRPRPAASQIHRGEVIELRGPSPRVQPLEVHQLTSCEELAGIADEWRPLDTAATPRTPFTAPDWILPWWRHFRRDNLLFRDEFFAHVVRSADGRLVAIAPLMRSFLPGRGPPLLRIVQFFGTDPSLTEFRGMICRPEDHDRVVQVLAEHFLARREMWDVFRWHGLRQPVAWLQARLPACRVLYTGTLPDYLVELPATWDEMKARVSSNMRKNLRKSYEFLERDGLAYRCRVVAAPGDLAPALERFLAVHAARANAAGMIRHPNKFARPNRRAFLAEYLHGMAASGRLALFELEINGTTVASRLAFRLDGVLYMYFAGFDPAWRRYSVMTVLVTEMIKWALANGVTTVNLSTGRDQSKLRWKPVEIVLHEAVQVSPTRRGQAAVHVFHAYQAVASFRRRSQHRLGLSG